MHSSRMHTDRALTVLPVSWVGGGGCGPLSFRGWWSSVLVTSPMVTHPPDHTPHHTYNNSTFRHTSYAVGKNMKSAADENYFNSTCVN